MTINPFKLETYLAQYEFSAPYLLCCSDAQTLPMQELLRLATPEEKNTWDHLTLGYTEVTGLPKLREQISTSLYPSLKSENILTFSGAEDAIFCALHTLCGPEDHIITFTPCYQSLFEIPRLKGTAVTTIPLRPENEWRIDMDDVRKAMRKNTAGIIINFPHNPTGQVISEQTLKELINLCDHNGLWLFSDEVYRLLGKPDDGWAPNAADIYPRALSLGVMSKSFGMAGLRVGWLACEDISLLSRIEKMKHYTSICNSAPAEILSLIALREKDSILRRNNAIVTNNLLLLDDFFQEYKELFEWIRPQGGCVGFVHYKGSLSVETLTHNLVRDQGVLLMPASVYDLDTPYFRIGFGRENMPESLRKFKVFLENH